MAHELGFDKLCTGVAFTYETKERLMLKFAKPGESFSSVVRRVCEDLVKDVKLPKKTLDAIRAQMQENREKRMKKRAEEARRRKTADSVRNIR